MRLAFTTTYLLRRAVLGSYSRSFKQVFDVANMQLKDTFGMEMVELPNKEKVTIRQKRGMHQACPCLFPANSTSCCRLGITG